MIDTTRKRAVAGRRGFTIVELLALVAVIALAIALLLPLSRSGGQAARRAQCSNNLRQIALALHNYELAHGALPPAYTVDARGRPLHSWRTLILPYLDQQSLYDTIDLARPWDDPANANAAAAQVWTYNCPGTDLKPNRTTYLAVASPNAALKAAAPRPGVEITDPRNATILAVEVDPAQAVPWMAPLDASEASVLAMSASGKPHSHPGGFNAAFADMSVRFLKASFPPATLRALMSVAGGETVPAGAY